MAGGKKTSCTLEPGPEGNAAIFRGKLFFIAGKLTKSDVKLKNQKIFKSSIRWQCLLAVLNYRRVTKD
jgi:hypothetical protein